MCDEACLFAGDPGSIGDHGRDAAEAVGQATGDTKLEWSGTADKIAGAAQNTVGDLKNAAGEINGKVANLLTWVGNYVARIF